MARFKETHRKLFYYARNAMRDIAPQVLFRRRLSRLLVRPGFLTHRSAERLQLLQHAAGDFYTERRKAVPVSRLPFGPQHVLLRSEEFARYFAPDLLIDLEFGDVIEVPKMPSIVKDRPLAGEHSNGILFS